MRERLRKTKTDVAAFPHGYPRDMKHVSLSILYILQSPDAGQSMEDVCSHSSLLAQVTRSLVMTWVTADSPGLLPSCGRRTLFRWSQKKTIGQLLLWPTFNWVDTLKTTQAFNKGNEVQPPHELAAKVSSPPCVNTRSWHGDTFRMHTSPPKYVFDSWYLLLIQKKNWVNLYKLKKNKY